MVGPRIYHVHQTRSYSGFANPSAAFEAMNSWLRSSDFKVYRKTNTFSRGSKHGVHVNFVPKFRLLVEPCPDGSTIVKFDYYGKMKVGTLVVVGILTSGISTAVGVATYAMRLLEADQFAASFWSFVDTLARGPISVLKVERWGHDKHGHYVRQDAPVVVQQPPVVVQQPVVQQPIVQQPIVQQPVVVQQPVMVPVMVPQPYAVPVPQPYLQSQQGFFPSQQSQQGFLPFQQQPQVSTRKSSDYPGNYYSQQNTSNQQYLTNANSQQQISYNTSQRQLTAQGEYSPTFYTSSQQPQVYGHQPAFTYPQQSQYPQHPQQQQTLPSQQQPSSQQYYPSLDRQSSQPMTGLSSSYPYPAPPASLI